MKKVYEQLLQTISEEKMNEDGKYLTYYHNTNQLASDYGLENDREAFKEQFYNNFHINLEEIEGSSFIILEDSGAIDGNVYVDPNTAYDDVMHLMKSEKGYKKYIK